MRRVCQKRDYTLPKLEIVAEVLGVVLVILVLGVVLIVLVLSIVLIVLVLNIVLIVLVLSIVLIVSVLTVLIGCVFALIVLVVIKVCHIKTTSFPIVIVADKSFFIQILNILNRE